MAGPQLPARPAPPLRIGVSECLTGAEVRYDGSGAASSYPSDMLSGLFEVLPYCPEMAVGMGVPRPPIRMLQRDEDIRVVDVNDPDQDFTDRLQEGARKRVAGLRNTDIAGYVLMKNSPSCGLFRVKVYEEKGGIPHRHGRGVFAEELTRAWPELPVEESGRLNDDVLRENFVNRVFAYADWRRLEGSPFTAGQLIAFHSRYKYLLMASSYPAYRACGRLLSNLRGDLTEIASAYIRALMEGLSAPATRGGHANVLSHLQGYLKKRLQSDDRRELAETIDAYRRGELPLLAPLTLLGHHLRTHPEDYVLAQAYLEPHPSRAGLRRSL